MQDKLSDLAKELKTDAYDAVRKSLEAIVHHPSYSFYVYQWIDYQNDAKLYRLKCWHDIRLKDGREILGCRPNADRWHSFLGHVYSDSEVTHIRISKKDWDDTEGLE